MPRRKIIWRCTSRRPSCCHTTGPSPRAMRSRWNFEKNNYLIQSAKLQVAKQLNHPPLGLALAIKKPFDGGLKEFQVNFSITYYLR